MKRRLLMLMSKRSAGFLLLLGLVISLSTCEKNAISPAPIILPAVVSFNNDIQPLFSLYCSFSGCHSGSDPAARLDLDILVILTLLFLSEIRRLIL